MTYRIKSTGPGCRKGLAFSNLKGVGGWADSPPKASEAAEGLALWPTGEFAYETVVRGKPIEELTHLSSNRH
jgi:hypothetical protein